MTPEGAALPSSQLQITPSCAQGAFLQPYPQYVYQIVGAPQIQPAQYSVIGFQPLVALSQTPQPLNLHQQVIPTFSAVQPVLPVANQVPDFTGGPQNRGLPKTRNPAKTNATQQKPTQSWQKPTQPSKNQRNPGKNHQILV